MNSDKFGKLILELRKEKNMTQQELANALHITDKAISKWERGVGLPDIGLLESIADIFDVSIAELVKGEKLITNTNEEIDNIIVDTLKDNKTKLKKKNIIIIILSICVILFIILLSFFINNYNKSVAYYIDGISDNFVSSGIVTFSNQGSIIELSDFMASDIVLDKIDTFGINIYFDNKQWAFANYDEKNANTSIEQFLNDLKFAEYNFEKNNSKKFSKNVLAHTFNNNCLGDSFECTNKDKFPNNMKIVIKYCDLNKNCQTETMKINIEEIVTTKKIF